MTEDRSDPRMLRSREAMLSAASDLLTEGGLEAITHKAVAARAGVGRATVYRHWPDLLDLRLATLAAGALPLSPPPPEIGVEHGGDPRAELAHHLRVLANRLDVPASAVLAAIIGGADRDDGIRRLRQGLMTQLLGELRPAVAAAIKRGQLRPDVTAETFAMSTVGPLLYQRFLTDSPLDDKTVDTVLDAALRAWAPTPADHDQSQTA